MIKLAILTTTRAEYGLMKQLIFKIRDDEDFELSLLVSGTHTSEKYGHTISEIEEDKVPISFCSNILCEEDGKIDISKTMAKAISVFSDYFMNHKFDFLLVDGDRYETFAICVAAVNNHIPIIHCGGGATTEGASDEYWRHCITKLSYLHFPTMELYKQRIINMGESPDRVFCVGSLGLDNITSMELASKQMVGERLGITLDKPYALVTFHPVTLEENTCETQTKELLNACASYPDMKFVFTKANADKDGEVINRMLEEYVNCHKESTVLVSSLGAYWYLSAMKYCEFLLGNSSSGLIEAPSFKVPTINIGDRQKGRVKAKSVIDCKPNENAICEAMSLARSNEFKYVCQDVENPNGNGHASEKIVAIIKEKYSLSNVSLEKTFYDRKDIK